MSKRVLLCLSHSIEEYDQLKLLSGLGYEVSSIGGYIDPRHPHDPKRPALGIDQVDVVREAVDGQNLDDNLGEAQAWIPDAILEWLGPTGIIIFHHYLDQRLWPQWHHLQDWIDGGGRVVWRTVGQSVEQNEKNAAMFRDVGLEIVRYSPREENIPGYAGSDALIRFYKDPEEWGGWTGEDPVVTNFTQELARRHPWTNSEYYIEATRGLACAPAGPGSEVLPGGMGILSYEDMKERLRTARAYLYTGTQPASYTLGLLEALMTGIPVISIAPSYMQIFPYGPSLYEGADLCGESFELPSHARLRLAQLLERPDHAYSYIQREATIAEFGIETVGRAWAEFLG